MLTATLLALGAAALHATWNLLIKTSTDRLLAAWGQLLAGGLLFAPALVATGMPDPSALPWLGASVLVHIGYVGALTRAYDNGDFSFAYPASRGGGALVAAAAGVVLLGDDLPGRAWIGVLVVMGGLASTVGRQVTHLTGGWTSITAVTIGTYTTLDAIGARRSSGFSYGITLTLTAGIVLSIGLAARGRARDMCAAAGADWCRYLVGGACATLAYSMILTAIRLAPVGYVATLRESSTVLGTAAGWLLLHEGLGPRRIMSAGYVSAGLVLLVHWQ
ncbi:MAG: EamA family transporter [Acidimicrobiales bacterium]